MKNFQKVRIIDSTNIDIPNLENLNWFKIVHRNNSPLFASFIRMGSIFQNPNYEFENTIKSQTMLNNDAYTVREELDSLVENITSLAKKDDNFLDRYYKLARKDHRNLIEFAKGEASKDWIDKKDSEILEIFQEFVALALTVTTHMYPPLGPEEWLVEEIQKDLSSRISDPNILARVLNELISPEEISMTQERDESILRVASTIKERGSFVSELSSLISDLFEKYGWVADDKFKLKYCDLAYFVSEVDGALQENPKAILNEFEGQRISLLQKKQNIIKKYALSDRTVHLCSQASELPQIRNLRREAIPEAAFYMRNFFQSLSRKFGTDHFTDYFHWEIVDILNGKAVDKEKIDDRPSGFGVLFINDSLYVGDRAGAQAVKNIIDKPVEHVDEIRGMVACFGKVTGIARVLFSPDEIDRVEEGNILVTAMTTPDFVPAMKKCAAVVTDEGGISCHASIVAREMKKPCVIGTKIATQVLKDGDMVEVDAEKGIVRKIK